MYSTTTISKNSKFSGRIVGTHQRLDQAARKALTHYLPRGKYFPASREIVHFEGIRGPDGLKRKSPGVDEPSHMLISNDSPELSAASENNVNPVNANLTADIDLTDADLDGAGPANASGHEHLDQRSVLTTILDHHWNLVRALKQHNDVRAAFEAAWMAHMLTDGLTPAHHFPLSKVQDELMTDKEMMRVFGQPIKGVMHGRSMLETLRNNWLYWGAGGHMSKHIAYEYGVAMIAATLPPKSILPEIQPADLEDVDVEHIFDKSLKLVKSLKMYERFCQDGWTTELALETKEILLPEIVKAVMLGWYSAAAEAYNIKPKPAKTKTGKTPKSAKSVKTAQSAETPRPKPVQPRQEPDMKATHED